MHGWRARLGFILTSANVDVEQESCKIVPDGVSCHFTRIFTPSYTVEGVAKMMDELEVAAKILGRGPTSVGVQAIGYATSVLSATYSGPEWANGLVRRMEQASGVPCTHTMVAIADALRALKVRRISLGMPYDLERGLDPRITEGMKSFYIGSGFEVVGITGGGLTEFQQINKQPPEFAYRVGKAADLPEAEAVVMNVTNFRTLEAIGPLEKDLAKPVVAGTQATIWSVLRKADIQDRVKGAGRLFSEF